MNKQIINLRESLITELNNANLPIEVKRLTVFEILTQIEKMVSKEVMEDEQALQPDTMGELPKREDSSQREQSQSN